ncbi:PPC domain-containing DNA-binding protein [Candidatus Soleaferrea massiliensis]|uniref:PPC domain-containing DNA-binding protein n=1 Tax=Candidatus Soleaferrea massiliensis TaxID=1470354 RepID=UPI00058DE84D|nr:PPC domain-containing DNA-binding protein [Candidatus Soleaferrea massiliensis]
MHAKRFGDTAVLRLEPSEEIIASVGETCEKLGIRMGTVSGIGAVSRVAVGLYRVDEKRYISHSHDKALEIVGLSGNVTQKDGSVYLHLHGSFADEQGAVIGGHLNEAVVSATAEIFIRIIEGDISRFEDAETGLNLMRF